MINNITRVGNCTSSEIVALLSMGSREMTDVEMDAYKRVNPKGRKKTIESWPGQAALTYIEECNMERRLGRSLTDESNARPLTWGKLLEPQVFDLLGLEYSLTSKDSITHPDIPYWAGSPDGHTDTAVVDMKCPLTLKSFCKLVHPLYERELHMTEVNGTWVYDGNKAINWVRENHKDGEKYYWQLVSNACLLNKQFAELIVYMPYKSELAAIKFLAQSVSGDEISKFYWIAMAGPDDLPFLIEDGYYQNVNIIRFEVPQADKDLLTQRVQQAGEYLIEPPSVITAHHDEEVNATIIQPA
jgi:hypothetical protein